MGNIVQDLEKNKTDILFFANEKSLGQVIWVEEKVSGKISWRKRKIAQLLDDLQPGDNIIVSELSRLFDADRRTIARWQTFWREHFPRTPFWKIGRARFVPAVDVATLPRSLLEAFVHRHDDRKGWRNLLRFLLPITTTGGLTIEVSR